MKPHDTIEITRKGADGKEFTFELVATSQKRGKDGINKLYPFFAEFKSDSEVYDEIWQAIGDEKCQEYVIEAFRRDVQLLYFARAKEDMEEFISMMSSPELSGRTITAKYCLAKALLYTSGKKGNLAKGIAEVKSDPKLAMEWMLKSQKCITEQMEESADEKENS